MPRQERKFDVFISYHNRDQQLVETLARKLSSRGVKPWLDIWNLIPGETWQPAMERALAKCLSCAVCLGRAGLGPWQSEEMRAAINRRVTAADRSFRVIPVLLPGTKRKNGLPPFLAAATWVEFKKGIDEQPVVDKLISGILGRPPGEARNQTSSARVQVAIRVEGTPEQFKKVYDAAQELLRVLAEDGTLSIKYVRSGSTIVVVDCTEEAFRRLEFLFQNGTLSELMGSRIEGVHLEISQEHGHTSGSSEDKLISEPVQAPYAESDYSIGNLKLQPHIVRVPSPWSLLVVHEDRWSEEPWRDVIPNAGFSVMTAASGQAGLQQVESHAVDVVMLDAQESSRGVANWVGKFKELQPRAELIVVSEGPTLDSVLAAVKSGASDIIRKPFAAGEIKTVLQQATARLLKNRRADIGYLPSGAGSNELAGVSVNMQRLLRIVPRISLSGQPTLIQGEVGTGKSSFARAIHLGGPLRDRPFVIVDCEATSSHALEEELFGMNPNLRDLSNKAGFVLSSGGTVVLEEIGVMPLEIQAKLVRALQEREFRSLPGGSPVPLNARIIATSQYDLEHQSRAGTFRRDLYMRLNVLSLTLAPLRNRKEDIPVLVHHFLNRMDRSLRLQHTISADALKILIDYDWPGNVRELENCVRRAATLSSGVVIQTSDIPPYIRTGLLQGAIARTYHEIIPLAEVEKQTILGALERLKGDKLLTARLLGIGKATLHRKLREYGIQWERE